MVNNDNGNGTNIIGMAADVIDGVRENIFGTEGVLTDVNMLGMQRPLAALNIASQLREQGGILSSLRTGTKKMTAARKGGRTSAPPLRYQQPPPAGTGAAPRLQNGQPNQVTIEL